MSATIRDQFAGEMRDQGPQLQRARVCAALTDPSILPPMSQTKDEKLPESYQSVGSLGTMTMEGKMLMALFPPGQPWFHFDLSPEVRYAPGGDTKEIQLWEQRLYLRELLIQATLESSHLVSTANRGGRMGFRSAKRLALTHLLVTGDVLEQLTDDYRMKVFRRNRYVTARDSSCDVVHTIVQEQADPLGLKPGLLSKTVLVESKLKELSANERMIDLYTRCQWQPWSKTWVIEQELSGQGQQTPIVINTSEDPITPFFPTSFRLVDGENYGRGLIELLLGDLRSLNEMELRRLELLGLMSKGLIGIDFGSEVRESDLAKPSGSSFRCKVVNGKAVDVGVVGFDFVKEVQTLTQGIQDKASRLGKSMLSETASAPQGEAGRSPVAWQRNAVEVDAALGGAYAPIADSQQLPLLQRTEFQLKRDNLLPELPNGAVQVTTLTGIAAISRAAKMGNIMSYSTAVAQFGPEGMRKIDIGVLADVMGRYSLIDEPGLIRTDEQVEAEAKAARGQELAQQAISSTGKIAEAAAAKAISQDASQQQAA